jgi:transglutaminase-like putative cysteine protease
VRRRLIGALPLLLGASALGHVSAWPLALVLLAVIAAVSAVGPRWEVDAGRQFLVSVVGGGAGYLLASFAYEAERGGLGDGWTKLCCTALLAALARSLLIAPRGGYVPALALGFAALMFAGKAHHPMYAGYVVAFLASGVSALGQSERRVPAALQPWRVGTAAALLALAVALGLGTLSGLLRFRAWAQGSWRISNSGIPNSVGFSEHMDLGALDGLLDSERRVLRVRGARVDYLRGVILDTYQGGHWLASDAALTSTTVGFDALSTPFDTQATPGAVEIEAITERLERSFLPLQAGQLQTDPSTLQVDDVGLLRSEGNVQLSRVRFVPGSRDRALVAAPRENDLRLPRRLRRRLEALAAEWSEGATSAADKLRAIEAHLLTEYGYARAFERSTDQDPVLDFLFVDKRGHCEYFASALALLARAVAVPTRVVMGYRVRERSPFGYFVVRERNAHAWVEAWLPGAGWVTRDATPEAAQPQNAERVASYYESSRDALGVGYVQLTDWLGRRTLAQTSLAWLLGCAVLAAIVARGARRRARERALAGDEALLPFMQPLLDVLDRAGHVRRPDEPLEHLAARLPEEPAGLLRRYSALRYGGLGDGEALARDVSASVARLRRRA